MRYLPLTDDDRRLMLAEIGVASVDELYCDVPAAARLPGPIPGLPFHQGEIEVERALGAMAARNLSVSSVPSFLGGGAYRHHVPATVDHLIQRGEFLTAYTPYQPEIAQGTLQYLFEFQTQVAMLTAMDVANASMYDGATACAEAMAMANRVTKRSRVVLSGNLHPHYRDTTATLAHFGGAEIVARPPDPYARRSLLSHIDTTTSCVIVQSPDVFGHVHDFTALGTACHAVGALLIVVVTEPVSLGLLTPPGAMGADIVVGEGQGLGNPLNFGGPYVGLFATKLNYVRQMPGRLVGETRDVDGRRSWVLTLTPREQHIRREKATSNICTNSGLCALAFSIHLSLLGEAGFTKLARINHAKAVRLAGKLGDIKGLKVVNESFFNEFTVNLNRRANKVVNKMAKRGVLAGVPVVRLFPDDDGMSDLLLVTATECTTDADMDALARGLAELL
ncbi:MAG: aminomethyl-transferring glycine dehydrogenase subunit GcvPA [Rhodospirillaceae bacterium]